jgi:hypothetical protein
MCIPDGETLSGIEFQSLPSGLHLVESDIFHFSYTSTENPELEDRMGVVVFANRQLSEEEIERAGAGTGSRGRSMMSLGVLMRECRWRVLLERTISVTPWF